MQEVVQSSVRSIVGHNGADPKAVVCRSRNRIWASFGVGTEAGSVLVDDDIYTVYASLSHMHTVVETGPMICKVSRNNHQ